MVLTLLDLDEPKAPDPHDPEHHAGQCRRCHRPLSAEESLGYSIGPTCRKHLGITPRQPVRLARTKPGGDCPGQGDLLQEADDASDPEDVQSPLRWHYGDDARMWCYDCGGEVWGFEEGRICDSCERSEDPEGSVTPEEDLPPDDE